MNIQTMSAYALSVSSDTKYSAFSAEAWTKALEVTILGMGMVFAVLAILWFALVIFKTVFAKDQNKSKKVEVSTPASVAEPEPVAEADDGELIAVISAAIAAYRAEEEGCVGEDVNGFRVVSFKRAAKGRAWNFKN